MSSFLRNEEIRLADFPEVVLTETHLIIEQDMSQERWAELGRVLQFFERASAWLVGEWAVYGEQHFGDDYLQAIADATDRSTEGVRAAQWVAERVAPERRRTDLTWAHHKAVATLEPDEQERWLDKAASDGLTTRELYDLAHDRPGTSDPGLSGEAKESEPLEDAIRAVVDGYVADEYLNELVQKLLDVLRARGVAD